MGRHGGRQDRDSALTPQGAADLFAYFYSARFFDKPGTARNGKVLFESKQCATCHGITDSKAEGATPVAKWESLADPILLVQQMWNHSFRMRQAFARRGLKWQVLTGAELTDILVYLRDLPETNQQEGHFSNTSGAGGEKLFEAKGCVNCHKGELALENRLKNMGLTDIAVDMWNHAPRMLQTPPTFTQDEMRELLSYLWMRQLVYPGGSIADGEKVFKEQKCSTCHAGGHVRCAPIAGTGVEVFRSHHHLRALEARSADAAQDEDGGNCVAALQESARSGGPDRVPEFGAVVPISDRRSMRDVLHSRHASRRHTQQYPYFFRRATTRTFRVCEIAPGVSASLMISACSCWCRLPEPVAGLALSARPT